MKNTIKMFGIIVLSAGIWFSFAACDNPAGNGGSGDPQVVEERFQSEWTFYRRTTGVGVSENWRVHSVIITVSEDSITFGEVQPLWDDGILSLHPETTISPIWSRISTVEGLAPPLAELRYDVLSLSLHIFISGEFYELRFSNQIGALTPNPFRNSIWRLPRQQ